MKSRFCDLKIQKRSTSESRALYGNRSAGLSLILHAHLPFVRHPDHERFLEESWLFEAIADSYLPLAEVMQGWIDDEVPARLTLSISPTLLAMWRDPLLRSRTTRYLERRIELASLEADRTRLVPALNRLAHWYVSRFKKTPRALAKRGLRPGEGLRSIRISRPHGDHHHGGHASCPPSSRYRCTIHRSANPARLPVPPSRIRRASVGVLAARMRVVFIARIRA